MTANFPRRFVFLGLRPVPMSNEEFEEYRKKLLEKVQTGRENRDEITPRTVRNNGLRPHQALRKAISEGFNENYSLILNLISDFCKRQELEICR